VSTVRWLGNRGSPVSPADDFWRQVPADADDPDAVRALWIAEASRRDGGAMAATGWALGVMGQHGCEPADFLAEAFERWRASSTYTPVAGRRLLEELVAEPVAEPRSPDELDEALYEARCWAACRLVELGVAPVMEQRLYRVIVRAPLHTVPERALQWALDFAALHELESPWLLDAPRDHAPQ